MINTVSLLYQLLNFPLNVISVVNSREDPVSRKKIPHSQSQTVTLPWPPTLNFSPGSCPIEIVLGAYVWSF